MALAAKVAHRLAGLGLWAIACVAVAQEPLDTASAARDSAAINIANRTVLIVRGPIAGSKRDDVAVPAIVGQKLQILQHPEPCASRRLQRRHGVRRFDLWQLAGIRRHDPLTRSW